MQTKQLSKYLNSIQYSKLSSEAKDAAKKAILDIIGVAISGSTSAVGDIWRKYFLSYSSNAPKSVVMQKNLPLVDYRQAAALNAAYGHILDFDDVHNSAIAHLGVVTVPGALTIAQSRQLSGQKLIEAVIAGYELGARIGYAINPDSYRIWHTTGVVGAFSTCAAAGKLMELNDSQMLNAIGSAGTQASGLWEFMADGAMSKPLHTANATLCGIRSAELAALGLTGASRILEGSQGLLHALTDNYRPELLVENLGGEYQIVANSFKLYPCCRHTHSAIYSMIKLLKRHPIHANQVVSIRSHTYSTSQSVTDRPSPSTSYACKFSMQYCLSAIVQRGGYDPAIFSSPAISDPSIRELMKKVVVINDDEINRKLQKDSSFWGNHLEVCLSNGTVLSEDTDYPPGDSHTPLTWQTLAEKFHSLSDCIIGVERATCIEDRVFHLEDLKDVSTLFN